LAIAEYFRQKNISSEYNHYKGYGNEKGIYYRDRIIISGDRVNTFRDIIYKNEKGGFTFLVY
jgi:hypothetical protein